MTWLDEKLSNIQRYWKRMKAKFSKVNFFHPKARQSFQVIASGFFGALAAVLTFVDLPAEHKVAIGISVLVALLIAYVIVWIRANLLRQVDLKIEGSTVEIKVGDIFKEQDFKAIPFNDFFDTLVDDKLIAKTSINGQFLQNIIGDDLAAFDAAIEVHSFEPQDLVAIETDRKAGKLRRYKPGTMYVHGEYLITAFAKFNKDNRAELTMPEYLEFLINFWDKVNNVYAQKSVTTPIFGSGITRIKGHRYISDEDLLKIMLWTFRISEMRFKHPAKLTIVIHEEKIDEINLLDIKGARNGL